MGSSQQRRTWRTYFYTCDTSGLSYAIPEQLRPLGQRRRFANPSTPEHLSLPLMTLLTSKLPFPKVRPPLILALNFSLLTRPFVSRTSTMSTLHFVRPKSDQRRMWMHTPCWCPIVSSTCPSLQIHLPPPVLIPIYSKRLRLVL